VAESPLGPWRPAPESAPALLQTSGDLLGPGHNSLTVDPYGEDVIIFHSWDAARTRREMYGRRIVFEEDGPRVAGPVGGATSHDCPPG
jgi:GH43 family beta-xylosidase